MSKEIENEMIRVFGNNQKHNNYFDLIRQWAENKEIFKHSSVKKQIMKLNEEVDELKEAIVLDANFRDYYKDELEKELGDVVVVLTILAAQLDLRLEDCIKAAYNKIKNRTGKMVNGVFVKDEI